MAGIEHQAGLEDIFERIEATILPSISMMLDTLLDAAELGRSGVDAAVYGAELRTVALQLESLTRQVETISPVQSEPQSYLARRA